MLFTAIFIDNDKKYPLYRKNKIISKTKMPASMSLIVYIVEQNVEAVNNYTIQRGIRLSHIPDGEPQRK